MAISTNLSAALRVIGEERAYQDGKWGTLEQHPHELGAWLLIMEDIIADARKVYRSKQGDKAALHEVRKLLAVGIACAEQHGLPGRFE